MEECDYEERGEGAGGAGRGFKIKLSGKIGKMQ